MFTAAKLISALFMAGLGVVVSLQVIPRLPEGTDPGAFVYVNAAIGAVFGWRILGARAGGRTVDGINNGLTTVAVMVIVGLFAQGANEMLRRALLSVYDGPIEALKMALDMSVSFGKYLLDPLTIITLIAGAVLGGVIAEFISRRWR